MKALKASVIIMGALIVVLLTIVIVTIVRRAGDGGAQTAAGPQGLRSEPHAPAVPVAGVPAVATGRPPGFAETTVALPPGAQIVETRAGDSRIVLRLRTATGGAALLLIDPDTGRRLGLIRFAPDTGGGR